MKEYICKEVQTENGGYLEIENELIRCKDCIHYSRISIGEKKLEIGRCTSQDVWDSIRARLSVMDEIEYIQVSADDFCSNAEPKDNRK